MTTAVGAGFPLSLPPATCMPPLLLPLLPLLGGTATPVESGQGLDTAADADHMPMAGAEEVAVSQSLEAESQGLEAEEDLPGQVQQPGPEQWHLWQPCCQTLGEALGVHGAV